MSDDEIDERWLQHARDAFAPKAGDAGRVFEGIRRAIAAGTAVQAQPAADTALRASAWRWIGVLALVGATGALSYHVGYRAGSDAASHAVAARPAPAAGGASGAAPKGVTASEVAAAPAAAPVVAASSAPRGATRAPTTREPAADASSAAQTLEREVQMMKRIERALREQNPQQALVLLGQLDRDIPGGQLAEERLAVFARARCGLGLGSPAAIAREFAQKYPKSVYFAHVRQACAAGEDAPVPFD
jgi:hypothetical protein